MIGVFGQFGSGNKFLAKGIATAVTGLPKFEDEPSPATALRRWMTDDSNGDWMTLMKFFTNVPMQKWHVVKDHFLLPHWMKTFASMENSKCVYLHRRTLGQVQYLLQWESVLDWLWYHEGIIKAHPELSLRLWPEDVQFDYVPAKLAVAHVIQCHIDLRAAYEYEIPVIRGEDLFAEYSVAWPALFMALEIEPRREWDQWLGANRTPPFYPVCTDKQMLKTVLEVEERASDYLRES